MGIKAHYLNDPDGNKFYPYAHADATFDRNGEKVGTRLDNADAEIEELKKRTNTAVQSVKIGDVEYKNGTDVVLPEYPTTLPASDVYDWAKQPTKPSYTKDEITGLENVENKSSETIRSEITKNNVTTALGYTPYTPNEVDNKLSALETNIDWKEAVGTFNDIATTYPNPVDGWTVNVKDTDYTYRYNGNSWIAISANAIPKATNSVDGLLSKEDHTNYNDANSKKHVHSNKSVIDGITDTLVNDWNAAKSHADSSHARIDATNVKSSTTNGNILVNGTETVVYTHPSGTNPHGTTKSDVGLGNVPNVATNNQTPTYTESSTLEKLTSGEKLSVAFGKISKAITDFIAHIGDTVKHISSSERTNWNKAYTHSQSNHAPVNAEENQNAFSNIVVGSTTISADAKSDSLEFSGKNVTITPDSTNDKLTIGITKDNVISALGYTPGSSEDTNTTYKLTKSGSTITLTGSDGSKTSVEDDNTGTTYGVATSSALGLVKSGTDITVDSNGNVSVNDDSHNHVISNIDGLQSALDGKANSSHGNHVPATETANNAKFLRNDNTWQTVTPANIGAAAASHTHSSYVNQNAFSNVKVGETTVSADNTTDTLTLVAGSNVTITPDADNDKITISAKDTVYTHPTSSGNKHIPSGGSSGQILRWSADGTAAWGADNNTTYSAGTGLSLSGTTFNHSNSVTAGTAQGDASKTLTFGETFTIPTVTYDAQGHVTGKGTTTMTMPANPNVDTKVTQTVTTSNASYPLLLAPSGQTDTATTTSYFDSGVTLNPSTNTIVANISGNASSATKATQDSAGQQINTTYIKGLSVSGTTITYTKGNGTTGTITTQDTNTWRGIQNNLTSTSTTDSLSANQGKVLKDLVDTKATGSGLTFTVVNGILNVTYD